MESPEKRQWIGITGNHNITGFCMGAFLVFFMCALIYSPLSAEGNPENIVPVGADTMQADYFFPLSGFPDCSFKSSRVHHTSYNGFPAIGYTEYLDGQPYLKGYELLPDANLTPAELYTELTSQISDAYGAPAVINDQKAYPEPDNRLQIWFNQETHARIFVTLSGAANGQKCYIAFVDYE